jgi:Spy/CpxP family protein refolding chaperone
LEPGTGPRLGGPLGPGQGAGFGLLAGRLQLTDEQKAAIKNIFEQAQEEAQAAQEAVAEAQNGLHEAVRSGATEEEIKAAGSALGTAIGNRAAIHARTLTAAKAALTAEQLQELEKIQETRPQPRGRMQGWGMGRGFGPGRAVQPPADGSAPNAATRLQTVFETADADKDGTLSLEEFQAFHGTMRGGRPFRGR